MHVVSMYERRGDEVYPSVFNNVDDYGVPAFEIRGDEVYPSVYNNRYDYGLPAFELRDGEWYPSVYNDHDGWGSPAFEVSGDEVSPSIYNDRFDSDSAEDSDSSSNDDLAQGLAFIGLVGLAGWAAFKNRQRRREEASRRRPLPFTPQPTQQPRQARPAPAGWYLANGEQRYWDGQNWSPYRAPQPQEEPIVSTSAAPGWYSQADGRRYWDGQRWTEHHIPNGVTPNVPPVAAQQPYYAGPQWPRSAPNQSAVVWAWVVAFLTAGYMLPWAVAATRGRPDVSQIGMLNAFLGWTVVGWIVALVRALR